MKCPFKFGSYPFEGGEDCIGSECGFHRSVCGMSKDNLAAEHGVSRDGVDANDSREKLEADVRKEIEDYAGRFLDGEKILYELMVSMLDRQAVITRAELVDCASCPITERNGEIIAELQAKVDVLDIENSELCDVIAALEDIRAELERERDESRLKEKGRVKRLYCPVCMRVTSHVEMRDR